MIALGCHPDAGLVLFCGQRRADAARVRATGAPGEVAVTHAGCCWLTRLHHKQASRWRNYATQLATLLRRTPTPRRRMIPAGRPRAAKTRSYQPVQVGCEVDLRPADADTADPSGQVEVQPLGHVILVG